MLVRLHSSRVNIRNVYFYASSRRGSPIGRKIETRLWSTNTTFRTNAFASFSSEPFENWTFFFHFLSLGRRILVSAYLIMRASSELRPLHRHDVIGALRRLIINNILMFSSKFSPLRAHALGSFHISRF